MREIDTSNTLRKDIADKELVKFLNVLSKEERVEYDTLELESSKDKFITKILESRTKSLRAQMNNLSLDKYMAEDITDITDDNFEQFLAFKTSEQLERELQIGLNEMKRIHVNKALECFVKERGKYDSDGKLNVLVSPNEFEKLNKDVTKVLIKNPTYKMSLVVINNSSGSISLFNDKMVESKRDYECYKEMYCNEKGMTPESFDAWMEYVKVTMKHECLETDSGFSSLTRYDSKWHKSVFKRFYKRDVKFDPDNSDPRHVYSSTFLVKLDEYDAKKLSKSKKGTPMASILDMLNSATKLKPVDADKKKTYKSTDTMAIQHKRKSIVDAKNALKKSVVKLDTDAIKAKHVEPKIVKKPSDSFEETLKTAMVKDMGVKKDETKQYNATKADEKVIDDMLKVKDEAQPFELAKNEPNAPSIPVHRKKKKKKSIISAEILTESFEETPEEINEIDITPTPKTYVDADDLLKEFRSPLTEDKVLVKYEKQPDPSVLRNSTVSNPKTRIQMYKDSAITNGLRLYLPYSGYEVVVKKLHDKSKISHLFSLMNNSNVDLTSILEQEVFRIIYDSLVFLDIEHVEYVDFIKNLSQGDIPILMIAMAMTNVPENKDGRVILPITSLNCTNPNCFTKTIPIQPINVDLKDLFSKIYPLDRYVDGYKDKLRGFNTIEQCYRHSRMGRAIVLTAHDELCEYTIYLSKPTIYKEYTTNNQFMEVNYELAKEELLDKVKSFSSQFDNMVDIADLIEPLNFRDFDALNSQTREKVQVFEEESDKYDDDTYTAVKKELAEELAPLAIVNNLLETNANLISDVMQMVKFIDIVKVETKEEKLPMVIIDDHSKVLNIVQALSTFPAEIIDELKEKMKEIDNDTKIYEHDGVYYESENIAGKITEEFMSRFSKSTDDEFVKRLNAVDDNLTQEDIDRHLETRESERQHLAKGRCTCGNDHFNINYISIIFFSIFKV